MFLVTGPHTLGVLLPVFRLPRRLPPVCCLLQRWCWHQQRRSLTDTPGSCSCPLVLCFRLGVPGVKFLITFWRSSLFSWLSCLNSGNLTLNATMRLPRSEE